MSPNNHAAVMSENDRPETRTHKRKGYETLLKQGSGHFGVICDDKRPSTRLKQKCKETIIKTKKKNNNHKNKHRSSNNHAPLFI
jgi:hypothetical protein